MSTVAKIHLSTLETELIQNKEWILTKHTVINKVYDLFGKLNEVYKQIANEKNDLHEFYNGNGKISKGENYEGLPYVILDYPASFSKENIFAIRTMFWWGNFFSITFHLSGGKYKLNDGYSKILAFLIENNFFVCIGESEWEHTFDAANYISARELELYKFKEIANRKFFKISKNLELHKWSEAPGFLEKSFREIIDFIKISFPTGEKVLSPEFPKAGSGL